MYSSFSIKNFRCFHDFTIENLSKINLIAGKNNAGKTTLLESLFIHSNAYDPRLLLKLLAFRGMENTFPEKDLSGKSPWGMNYYNFDNTQKIVFSGDDMKGMKSSTELHDYNQKEAEEIHRVTCGAFGKDPGLLTSELPPILILQRSERGQDVFKTDMTVEGDRIHLNPAPPPLKTSVSYRNDIYTLSLKETAQLYSNLVLKEREGVLIESLRILEPELKKLEIITSQGNLLLHAKIGSKPLMPIYLMGQGMVLLSSIILQLSYAAGGIFLIDEIDNGLHHSIIEKVWGAIGEAAQEFNTQVFATTHSFECIQAAHIAFSSKPEDFRYFRLDKRGDDIVAQTYDDETLGASIDMNLEVR